MTRELTEGKELETLEQVRARVSKLALQIGDTAWNAGNAEEALYWYRLSDDVTSVDLLNKVAILLEIYVLSMECAKHSIQFDQEIESLTETLRLRRSSPSTDPDFQQLKKLQEQEQESLEVYTNAVRQALGLNEQSNMMRVMENLPVENLRQVVSLYMERAEYVDGVKRRHES